MRIAQEEIFGPVLVMIPFDDDEDAIRIANQSQYGLGAAVSSGDFDRAMAVATRIRAGSDRRQRGQLVRGGLAVRRLQGQRRRPPKWLRGIRAVPRNQDVRPSG